MKVITMKLTDKTVQRIESITANTGESNRTRIFAQSVEVFELLVNHSKNGAKLIIEQSDGTKESLVITGVN